MRIYIFVDEEMGSLFILPWYKEESPIIVEAKIRRYQNNKEEEIYDNDKKPN
jgi:hypothetical protein